MLDHLKSSESAREQRLRRALRRDGYRLCKRRDGRGYYVIDAFQNSAVTAEDLTLDEAEAWGSDSPEAAVVYYARALRGAES